MIAVILGAVLVGASLGLLGAGGSILTVPVLVYGVGLAEKTAIAASLVVVGTIALAGTLMEARRGLIKPGHVVAFGVPGMAGAAAGGTLAGIVPGSLQMGLFAVVLLVAAATMQRQRPTKAQPRPAAKRSFAPIGGAGAAIGAITGLIGVGGGFLVVPALLRFAGLELRAALANSLALIAVNCAVGLLAQWAAGAITQLPLVPVATFAGIGTAGLVAGQYGARVLPHRALRTAFTGMLVLIGLFTLTKTALAG